MSTIENNKIDEQAITQISALVYLHQSKHKIGYLLCILFGLAGILGMIIHGSYSEYGGPVYIKNEFFSIWLAAILFFLSLQSVYISFENKIYPISYHVYIADYVYYPLMSIGGLFIAICYGIGGKYDVTSWSVLVCVLSVFNVLLIHGYDKDDKEASLGSKKVYPETTEMVLNGKH